MEESGRAPVRSLPQRTADSPIRFEEIGRAAGLNYRWQIDGPRPLNILQTIGNGCAFLDYDGDGNLDILLVGKRVALFRGDGHAHFKDVSAAVGLDKIRTDGILLGCAVGDYDNDGWPDIYLSGYRSGILLHNESGRSFRDVTAAAGLKPQPFGTSCSFFDADNDGRLDLYVCNYIRFGPETVPQLCNHGGKLTACGPLSYESERGTLYRNLGGGRFADVTAAWGANAVSGKALGAASSPNGTGTRASLAIANDEMPGDLLTLAKGRVENIGPRSGTAFNSQGNPHGGMGIDWGDYDNDGRLDLAVATFQGEAKAIFHNESNMVFEDRSHDLGIAAVTLPYVAFGMKWCDFDNDGWLDLAISNGDIADNIAEYEPSHTYRQPSQLFRNEAGKSLVEVGRSACPQIAGPIVGRGLAVGDIDNDGKMDLLIVDSEGVPLLFHNRTPAAGHWVAFRLKGTVSNRDGIGAVITITAGSKSLVRHCHTDGSYLSASDRRVHFGIGTATSASVTVKWPSGRTTLLPNVKADQIVDVSEGS